MPRQLDERIVDAINQAVTKTDQSDDVAKFIVNWFTNLLSGNTDFNNKDDTKRNIERLLDAVKDSNN